MIRPALRRIVPALAVLAVVAFTAALPASPAARPSTQEYDLKAAFLFNFAQFVEWPDTAFASASTPLTIAILGDDPFGSSLDEIVSNESAHNRRLEVRHYRSVDEIGPCHILFIGQRQAPQLKSVLARLSNRSVLTVGESKDFTSRAGMVGFELVQRRLKLRINLSAANRAGLTISSKLLRQAEIVDGSASAQ